MPQPPETDLSIESLMRRALETPGMVSLAAGFTDDALNPRGETAALVAELLEDAAAGGEALQYGHPQGRPGLRAALAAMVRRRDRDAGVDPNAVTPDDILVTTGSQQALYLALRALCRPGDAVLVESPTYFVFLDLLRGLGLEAIPMPARDDRLDAEALPDFLRGLGASVRERIRAAYVVSYFANPTGYSVDAGVKAGLVRALLGAGLNVPLLEDAAYRDFHFGGPWPAPSLLAHEAEGLPVIYAGTLTKTFATGFKVGFAAVRDPELRGRMLALKRVQDFGTANFPQAVLERAIVGGVFDAFLQRMRPAYARKGRALHEALLDAGMGELGWRWEEAEGAFYLWLRAPDGCATGPGSPFYDACFQQRVMYVPGSLCYADGRDGRVRLSFGNLSEALLPDAAGRLGRAAAAVAEPRPAGAAR